MTSYILHLQFKRGFFFLDNISIATNIIVIIFFSTIYFHMLIVNRQNNESGVTRFQIVRLVLSTPINE